MTSADTTKQHGEGRVNGRVAIITGAASGLGRADAIRLAEEGAHVVLTDVNEPEGRLVAEACGGEFIAQDVADESSWAPLVEHTVSTYGGLHILVNNAGIAPIATIETTTTEEWRAVMSIHVDGTFFGCRAAIGAMANSGGGSIINMSSIAGRTGLSGYLAYTAAKGAIAAMTRSIAAHCREQKSFVRCNTLQPGSISTPMVHAAVESTTGMKMMEQPDPEAFRKAMGIGEPIDVANTVLFLASDESKHINGTEIVIDNGDTVDYARR